MESFKPHALGAKDAPHAIIFDSLLALHPLQDAITSPNLTRAVVASAVAHCVVIHLVPSTASPVSPSVGSIARPSTTLYLVRVLKSAPQTVNAQPAAPAVSTDVAMLARKSPVCLPSSISQGLTSLQNAVPIRARLIKNVSKCNARA